MKSLQVKTSRRTDALHSPVVRQSKATSTYSDNRPEAVTQRKLHEMTKHSQDHSASVQLKQMLNPNAIQRMDKEEELLQGKFLTVQKKGLEEEELMQGKFEHSSMENDTGLPDNLKSGIENLSGFSMDDVKVHRNSDEPAKVQAHAFAQGTNIHLAPGQEKHLPHEAWHVVQQKQGRVKPTFQMKGQVNVNDDPGLETEADVMGAKANNNSGQYLKRYGSLVNESGNETGSVKQLAGDRYYWVKPENGTWTYVGAFKSHAEANRWWAASKSAYPNGSFSQGNSKTKFK